MILGEENRKELVDTLYQKYENYCDISGDVAKNYNVFKHFWNIKSVYSTKKHALMEKSTIGI